MIISAAALDAEYGLVGLNGASSPTRPRSTSPYTSSVLTWIMRGTSAIRHASNSMWVPSVFVIVNVNGSPNELSTKLSAARWTTRSALRTTRRQRSASQMSPTTRCTPLPFPLPVTRWETLSMSPAYVSLSRIVSRAPGNTSRKCSATWEPMNPQPPVTTIFMDSSPAATTPSASTLVRTLLERRATAEAAVGGPHFITFCTASTAGRSSGVRWQLIAEQAVTALATRGLNATASTPRGSRASLECASQQSCADLRPCCAAASDRGPRISSTRFAVEATAAWIPCSNRNQILDETK